MSVADQFDIILRRHEEIGARLSEGAGGSEFAALSRELAELEPVAAAIRAWRDKENERADLAALIAEPRLDPEIRAMAEADRARVEAELEPMAQAIRLALLPRDAADEGNVILEVRAGTGGDEAALFAGDLLRMYVKYAEAKGWKVDLLSASEGTAGGYKEVDRRDRRPRRLCAAQIRVGRSPRPARPGDGNAGTHPHLGGDGRGAAGGRRDRSHHQRNRSQDRHDARQRRRRPARQQDRSWRSASPTCRPASSSRCRRSARSIAIAPRRWRCCRARILDGRSQRANAERAEERRSQVGSGDRSQRIRTYNFPQGRVTDHRVNLTLYSLDRLMEGEGLDEIVDALTADRQARLLAEQAER